MQASTSTSHHREPRIIALMNQKGGVGKTTTTVNLGAGLARMGHRVLLIDLDPQGHLTLHLGVDSESLDASIYDLFVDQQQAAAPLVQQVDDGLFLLPAEVNLAGVETELAPRMITGTAQRILRDKLATLFASQPYDYVLLDCPPSLGLLTINGLTAANEIVVPMQAHFLALQGLGKLFETVSLISQGFNPQLRVTGIALCMHDGHTVLAGEVVADVEQFLESSRGQDVPWSNAKVFEPAIHRNIKLAESPSFGKTIFAYEPSCRGAKDYAKLAQSVHEASPHANPPAPAPNVSPTPEAADDANASPEVVLRQTEPAPVATKISPT